MVVDKYAVLVQHGEYFTLYSNLSEVFVKAGDKLITRQPIGRIQTSDEDGRTEVHLESGRQYEDGSRRLAGFPVIFGNCSIRLKRAKAIVSGTVQPEFTRRRSGIDYFATYSFSDVSIHSARIPRRPRWRRDFHHPVILLLFFGAKRIPELTAKGLGKGIKEFKDAKNGSDSKEDAK